jgi:DNA polymerase delta subunit 1
MDARAPLDVQLVDLDACQVKAVVGSGGAWIQALRSNRLRLDGGNAYEQVPLHRPDPHACFLVRLWCRSSCGKSVCVVICDPWRHVYRRLRAPGQPPSRVVAAAREVLHARTNGTARCELVERCTTAGWHCEPSDVMKPRKFPWLKISAASAWHLDRVLSQHRDWLDEVSDALGRRIEQVFDVQTAHRQLDVRTEVLEAIGVRAGGWFRIPARLLEGLRPGEEVGLCCGATLQLRASDLAGCAVERVAMAPLRVLSFDIECVSHSDAFPIATQREDAVICIGLYTKDLGAPASAAACTMLCLNDVDRRILDEDPEAAGTVVQCFATETELLAAFHRTIRDSDADVVAGYNTCLFDWRYIQERTELLFPPRERALVQAYSRCAGQPTPPVEQDLASSALGDNPLCYPKMPGRVNLDLWLYLKRENVSGLENLKLNTVSKHFLKDEKLDLEAKLMFKAYREGPAGRGKVAAYCRQDCKLVMDLVEKVEAIPSVWEMAKITCITPEDILFRGQQIKVYTQLVLKAHEVGYVVEDRREGSEDAPEDEDGYQGATVVDPTPGYYLEPVFCLDFASLYPSLMRTKNLSPDCLVRKDASAEASSTPTNDVTIRDGLVHRFVKGSVHEGLLPRILEQLLTERKRVKRLMEEEPDPRRRALLNRKQLALKISANSVYGACGATKGRLSCKECAEATTAAGRDAIDFTCRFVTEKQGFCIIYGDTDSAFMRIPEDRRGDGPEELFRMGEALAAEVTAAIASLMPGEKNYIKLEFEKILHPLVLYKKKRYTGMCMEDPKRPPKLMAKGLELVRKDACQIVKQAQREVIEALLQSKDLNLAQEVMMKALASVLKIPRGGPFWGIKQSKSLRAAYKDETSQMHCVVRDLMKQREAGSEPRVGDRVEFVVVASKSPRVVDKAEDVLYAELQGLPPDWPHYLTAIERPLFGILEVPLASADPSALCALRRFCGTLMERAKKLLAEHCMTRQGTVWVPGHLCKDGSVQKSLLAMLSSGAPRSAGTPRPPSSGDAPPAAPPPVPRCEAAPARPLVGPVEDRRRPEHGSAPRKQPPEDEQSTPSKKPRQAGERPLNAYFKPRRLTAS